MLALAHLGAAIASMHAHNAAKMAHELNVQEYQMLCQTAKPKPCPYCHRARQTKAHRTCDGCGAPLAG